MRILFYASYPDQPIGYSKVAHRISRWFADQPDVELHYFGIGNNEQERCKERAPHPNIHMIDVAAAATAKDAFGMDILADTLERLKPDILLIYNDIIVTCRAFNTLLQYRAVNPETRFVSYLDLVYPYEKLALIRHVDRNTDHILVFSECWRRNLLEMGVSPKKVWVFPHGFSEDLFYPLPNDIAKAYFGFADTDFIILNANRNTYRKAQDIALRAFVQFLVHEHWDPRIKMFLHCAPTSSSGYVIEDVLEVEACRHNVDVATIKARIFTFPSDKRYVEDAEMNLLYNAADVGLNTCMGEGFGLCQLEHAALGKPQIVSRVGALADIFEYEAGILVEPRTWIRASNSLDEHSGDLGICAAADFAAAMSVYFHDNEKRYKDGIAGATCLKERYKWSRILNANLGALIQPLRGARDVPRQSDAAGR